MSTLTEIQISNFKRISAATIKPDGKSIVIGGDNAQGKSSCLDAVAAAICGKKAIDAEPLRRGAKKGSITLLLDDGIKVSRTFTERGSYLKVENADGMSPKNPQAWLDKRWGQLIDPIAFLREPPKKQAATLRDLAGVDTRAMDEERAELYADRRDIGRDLKTAEGALKAMPAHEDAPETEVRIADLMRLRQEADEARQTVARKREAARSLTQHAERADDDARRLSREADTTEARVGLLDETLAKVAAETKADLAAAKQRYEEECERIRHRGEYNAGQAKKDAERAKADVADLRKRANEALELSRAEKTKADEQTAAADRLEEETSRTFGDIDEQIAGAETINAKVRANAMRAKQAKMVKSVSAKYDAKTKAIAEIDEQRTMAIAAASFPVDGLGFGEDGAVTYHDLPLPQASQAEQIRVSLAIGFALSPEIKVALVRDGSLLDAKHLQMVCDIAEEHGGQVLVERVGDKDAGAVIIEDGTVRAEGK